MKQKGKDTLSRFSFSQADKLAALAFLISIPLLATNSTLAPIPLVLYLLLCIIAPFIPQWGFFLPIISKSTNGSSAVALTFDDGPSPGSTPIVLQLLKEYNLKATFFVIGEKAERYPDLMEDILREGHSIGNHSWRHDNLLMLRSRKTLGEDIRKTQQILGRYGIRPLLFRPPAGATNPRLKSILQAENLKTVTYSCRPFDYGNKKITNLAERITSRLKPGDIILLHDLEPGSEGATSEWKQELARLFRSLKQSKQEVAPLGRLIDSEVMLATNNK